MPSHEFGIMPETPKKHKRYDNYTPEKYNCISVDDDYILEISMDLREIKFYWHTLERSESGLAYYGITLIPPESAEKFLEKISGMPELNDLASLLWNAVNQNKFVIHYGI
ncbi:MAG: hypothetical protein NC177_02520 [Ruminococcus flavefaciens]|nr:hypothetical protein [Ruminococcus flavefaciens]